MCLPCHRGSNNLRSNALTIYNFPSIGMQEMSTHVSAIIAQNEDIPCHY